MAMVLAASDNGKIIQVSVGSEVELRLPDNPSTGYKWTFKADENLLSIREGEYVQLSNQVGGGGERQWIITAKKPGTTQVNFKRWREWEGENSAIEHYQLTFQITS